MYAINLENFNVKECAELESGYAEISEEVFFELKNALQDETNPNISENGIDKFKAILGKALSGEQTWKIDSQAGSGQFKTLSATDKMTAPTVAIDATANVSTNAAVKTYVDAAVPADKTNIAYVNKANTFIQRQVISTPSGQGINMFTLYNSTSGVTRTVDFSALASNNYNASVINVTNGSTSTQLTFDPETAKIYYNSNRGNPNSEIATKADITPFGKGFYWRSIGLNFDVTYTSSSSSMTAIQIHAQMYFNNGSRILIMVNGYEEVARFNVDVGSSGKADNAISALVPPNQTFRLTQNNAFNATFGYLSAGDTPRNFQYLINNTTKEVFGFDDTQDDLYDEKMKTGDYVNCRLPDSFEEWDSNLKKWVLNQEKKNNTIIDNTKYQLTELISKYAKYTIPFYFSRFTKLEQDALLLFLNECDKLLKNVTIDTVIPEIPDFMKEL